MTGNDIGDEGAKAMSEMLKVNATLTELNLGGKEERRERERKKQKERMNDRQWYWSRRRKNTE